MSTEKINPDPSTQRAFHAVVHLVVGPEFKSTTEVEDYLAETLRGSFLDWSYVTAPDIDGTGDETSLQTPIEIEVPAPYTEGGFLMQVQS
jgi:hypothetical protein